MKKQFLTLALFSLLFSLNAQPPQKRERPNFTTDQKVELAVKKMTLALDLNAKQQNEVKPVIANQIKEREATMQQAKAMRDAEKKPTSDELFTMANKKLDAQIAFKNKMKSILTAEQFETFQKIHKQKMNKENRNEGFRKRKPGHKK